MKKRKQKRILSVLKENIICFIPDESKTKFTIEISGIIKGEDVNLFREWLSKM